MVLLLTQLLLCCCPMQGIAIVQSGRAVGAAADPAAYFREEWGVKDLQHLATHKVSMAGRGAGFQGYAFAVVRGQVGGGALCSSCGGALHACMRVCACTCLLGPWATAPRPFRKSISLGKGRACIGGGMPHGLGKAGLV